MIILKEEMEFVTTVESSPPYFSSLYSKLIAKELLDLHYKHENCINLIK